MTITALLVFGSALLTCAVSTILVFHPQYDDGLVRRFALALLAIGAYLRMAGILEHHDGLGRSFSHVAIVAWVGIALFLADHFYSFLRKLAASKARRRRQDDRAKIEKTFNGGQSC